METSAVFDLYRQLAPAELFRLLQRQMGVRVHDGIYSARLVIWMMMQQRLQRISVHNADMMEKELLVAVMAYNLVRAIMSQAAQRARIDPRQLSFTYACNIVLDGYPKVLAARTAKQQEQELERIVDLVGRCRLPKRTKRRSYSREVWGRGYRFPIKRREKN